MKIWKDDLYCVVADGDTYLLYEKTPNHAQAKVLDYIGRRYQVNNMHVHKIVNILDKRITIPYSIK